MTKDSYETRPTCSVPGCDNLAANQYAKNHPRSPYWRRSNWILKDHPESGSNFCCYTCHGKWVARKNGVAYASKLTANRQGMTTAQYQHKYHPYLKHRKTYCENVDGRLGFKCTCALPSQETLDAVGLGDWKPFQLLEVDHIDGNHTNNAPANLQTLCKQCHTLKTAISGDRLTPGRKTRNKIT